MKVITIQDTLIHLRTKDTRTRCLSPPFKSISNCYDADSHAYICTQVRHCAAVLWTNRAAAHLMLGHYKAALADCQKVSWCGGEKHLLRYSFIERKTTFKSICFNFKYDTTQDTLLFLIACLITHLILKATSLRPSSYSKPAQESQIVVCSCTTTESCAAPTQSAAPCTPGIASRWVRPRRHTGDAAENSRQRP